jgi:SAM-dependent methyltransferase
VPIHFLHRVAHRAERFIESVHERRLNISTSGRISLDELGLSHPERREYVTTVYRDFSAISRYLVPRGAFIDYGAGLGRVTILAAQMPFARVIGVDLSERLIRGARENIAKTRARLRCPVSAMCCDATLFPVPDDATTFYFANPFAGSVLAKVLDNIRASVAAHPRSVTLVCNLPPASAFENEIRAVSWLRLVLSLTLSHTRKGLFFTAG